MPYLRNPVLHAPMLPVEIVLHPSWWHRHEGITFDEDFYFHPARRVEVEQHMERALYERWGRYGLGADHGRPLPEIGPVHLAAGYLTSEMLGCPVEYPEDGPPQVIPAGLEQPAISPEDAFSSPAFKRLERLVESLKARYGYVRGDVGWGGVLNTALDLRGQEFFLDLVDRPEVAVRFVRDVAAVIERFTRYVRKATGTTSISVNRNVRHIHQAVHLHSECSNVMISTDWYEKFFLPVDAAWSRRYRPYGIHHCGADPHRFAASYAKVPHLDFLDVGWGGDVARLRRHLPYTFLNIRLSPVEIVQQTPEAIRATVRRLVRQADNPYLTGICCINMDDQVREEQVAAIFEEANELRREYAARTGDASAQGGCDD
ncbi:MAG TPA: hypothetical protein EYP56_22835 [Planctomycetaceae bacterium]|nr:hypothetical protein [Planctomycetaceae bacterium]HIQ22855.1 hypothetical protein [Planctomycetota bacterium]